uniref:Histidine kinase/HSP90-like ATPase domain-containing protein n=1 Tax=Fundulus heteroclitus TaxID=8078 RepID=A0A3Q2PRP7_FUNHE
MAAETHRGVPLSTLSPKFLHTNSTSHTWPFSAIAELIDNAYDPDVNAKQFWIDKTMVNGELCLSFMDNGNGLDHETMHKMLRSAINTQVQPIPLWAGHTGSDKRRLVAMKAISSTQHKGRDSDGSVSNRGFEI